MSMTVTRRDDVVFEITFTDVDGEPIDLTGATVFFTVKKRLSDVDADAVIEKEITVFDAPETGVAELALDTDDTNIVATSYFYDIQLKDTNGKIVSSGRDKFIVNQDVTIRTS